MPRNPKPSSPDEGHGGVKAKRKKTGDQRLTVLSTSSTSHHEKVQRSGSHGKRASKSGSVGKGRANDKFTIEEVIAAIQEAGGLKNKAARLLGCTRQTVRRYIERYAAIQTALDETEEDLLDEAESQLREQIRAGQLTAIIFFLKTKGKGRGYTERVETTGKDGGPIEFQTKAEQVKSDMARKLARLAAGGQAP